jgi:hypothetical protein
MENQIENSSPKKSKRKKILWLTLASIALVLFVYVFICGFTYSEGTRVGTLIKVSKKGYLFKTYEGEMVLGGVTSTPAVGLQNLYFNFSVRDKIVYDQIEAAQGKKVVLHYKQVMKNFFWQGETDYFVYQISIPAN